MKSSKPIRGRKTPLDRINEIMERENQPADRALLKEQVTRLRLALFGCAPQ